MIWSDVSAIDRVVILEECDAGVREKKRAVVAIAVVNVLAWDGDIGKGTCKEIRSRRLLPLVEIRCGIRRVGWRSGRFERSVRDIQNTSLKRACACKN